MNKPCATPTDADHDPEIHQSSIVVKFTQITFWGKPEELHQIIAQIQQEATWMLAKGTYSDQQFNNLLADWHTARNAYAQATQTQLPVVVIRAPFKMGLINSN